jgi:thioredoxin reductase (NADPH)
MKDVIIIGAGPIGLACGIAAAEQGLSFSIFDKGTLVNSLYHYPLNMTFFSTSDRLEIGGVPFISQNPKPTRSELYENIHTFSSLPEGGFLLHSDKGSYKCKHLVVATGFYDFPYLLNVPGEELTKVLHYYREPHPFYNMDIAIVGAANSAVDAALETYRKGAKSVSMIIREKTIGENVKYWARPDIVNRIEEGSIKAYFESNITEITAQSVRFQSPDGKHEIPNDFVLAMTGYQPNFSLLEQLGVGFQKDVDRTPVYDEKTMESNVKGVYLAGVVCGGLRTNKWFIENSREHAPLIMQAIKAQNN